MGNIWEMKLLGTDVYNLVYWFFIYSFMGWVIESIAMSIKFRRLWNRGFVKGPFCTIYAVGALIVYFVLKPYSENLVLVYFLGMILATILEYITAIIMEKCFKVVWWDYTDYPNNFQGKICLGNSLIWGVFSVSMFVFLQPFVESLVALLAYDEGLILIKTIAFAYSVDFVYHVLKALNVDLSIKDKIYDRIQNIIK